MRPRIKTALGVDLSSRRVAMALVRRTRTGPQLVKAVSGDLPEGAIIDGAIQDPDTVVKVVAELRKAHGLRHEQAAVAFVGMPALSQILQLPKQMPGNMGQFVKNEIKQFVTVAADQMVVDYAALASTATGGNRLLAVAVDAKRVADLVAVCHRAHIRVQVVEPSLLAYVRSLYARRIAKRFDRNILVAVLREKGLDLAVFRSGHVDLVRSREVGDLVGRPELLVDRVYDEMVGLIQYYEIEVLANPEKWDLTLVVDDTWVLPESFGESLRSRLDSVPVEVFLPGTLSAALSLDTQGVPVTDPSVSAVAVGLAMRLLDPTEVAPAINLLPPETVQLRQVKKHALISSVVAAAMLCAMALSGIGVGMRAESVRNAISDKRSDLPGGRTIDLVDQRKSLEADIERINQSQGRLAELIKTQADVNWAELLLEIRRLTPYNVQITRLSNRGGDSREVLIEGRSLTYGAANLLANRLCQSKYITSSHVSRTDVVPGEACMNYQIRCQLKTRTGI